ncbi:hypothetical protein EJB05_32777 [Eragrostis curvula]|uniref:Protein DEFECTIVE IN MERISTEM SILENCING 3 n=1 Tax=Eragrostis curvula TaxID=38414 RepID=A0A5J9UIF5_9POAL|nr:hypothetical protein EJB05_32777 [Eragrostis curvula]
MPSSSFSVPWHLNPRRLGMEARVAPQVAEFKYKLTLKVNHHEGNIKFLKSELNAIEETCIDLGIKLGNYHASAAASANNDTSQEAEGRTIQSILDLDKTAAGIICQLKVDHHETASKMPLVKNILGIVATLGKVNDDNLSRLLSEYLGMDNMLALVCKTSDGVKSLEKYDEDGSIDKNSGVHGLGRTIGKFLDGRFTVFCLENSRPFSGNVNFDDPQRKLILERPRLRDGKSPPGFLDFAVNMIHLDQAHLRGLTASGNGLRETLFYSLFSHLQVYKTRADIERALPFISDGAISLDGGILRPNGSFCLGYSKNLEVKFAVSLGGSSLPIDISDMEEQLQLKNWEKERLLEDMKREEDLLRQVKELYSKQKEELMDSLTKPTVAQTAYDLPTTRSPATPGSNPFGAKPSRMR